MKKVIQYLVVFVTLISASCKKDKDLEDPNHNHDHNHNHNHQTPPNNPNSPPTYGKVSLNFENFVDNDTLKLNGVPFLNENGDTIFVNLFKYYISNVKLSNSTATFNEKESYHLISHDTPSSKLFTLDSVPSGTYNTLTFIIGVDSARNVSGVQSGALDPANGMFWSWNSGYIMAKLEGTSPQSGQSSKMLKYHIGGFSGVNNVLKTITFNLSTPVEVGSNTQSKINLKANLKEWFKNPHLISVATIHTVHMPGANAKKIADNYANMFSVISVIN